MIDEVAGFGDRNDGTVPDTLDAIEVLRLRRGQKSSWVAVCQHLRMALPGAPYPAVHDIGVLKHNRALPEDEINAPAKWLRHDPSPWAAKRRTDWAGVGVRTFEGEKSLAFLRVCFDDDLA